MATDLPIGVHVVNKGRDYYRQKQASTRRPKNLAWKLRNGLMRPEGKPEAEGTKVEISRDGTVYARDARGCLRRVENKTRFVQRIPAPTTKK